MTRRERGESKDWIFFRFPSPVCEMEEHGTVHKQTNGTKNGWIRRNHHPHQRDNRYTACPKIHEKATFSWASCSWVRNFLDCLFMDRSANLRYRSGKRQR